MLGNFTEICPENLGLAKIGQKHRTFKKRSVSDGSEILSCTLQTVTNSCWLDFRLQTRKCIAGLNGMLWSKDIRKDRKLKHL